MEENSKFEGRNSNKVSSSPLPAEVENSKLEDASRQERKERQVRLRNVAPHPEPERWKIFYRRDTETQRFFSFYFFKIRNPKSPIPLKSEIRNPKSAILLVLTFSFYFLFSIVYSLPSPFSPSSCFAQAGGAAAGGAGAAGAGSGNSNLGERYKQSEIARGEKMQEEGKQENDQKKEAEGQEIIDHVNSLTEEELTKEALDKNFEGCGNDSPATQPTQPSQVTDPPFKDTPAQVADPNNLTPAQSDEIRRQIADLDNKIPEAIADEQRENGFVATIAKERALFPNSSISGAPFAAIDGTTYAGLGEGSLDSSPVTGTGDMSSGLGNAGTAAATPAAQSVGDRPFDAMAQGGFPQTTTSDMFPGWGGSDADQATGIGTEAAGHEAVHDPASSTPSPDATKGMVLVS